VEAWLREQPAQVLEAVVRTCTHLLVNKFAVKLEDMTDWRLEAERRAAGVAPALLRLAGCSEAACGPETGGPAVGQGAGLTRSSPSPQGFSGPPAPPGPLPEIDIIPPIGPENKEAADDRKKRTMLSNNVTVMQQEVTKICHRFQIPSSTLDSTKLASQPALVRDKVKVALTAVRNAEKTLTDFLNFLKFFKYKEWNVGQQARREQLLKQQQEELQETKQAEAREKAEATQQAEAGEQVKLDQKAREDVEPQEVEGKKGKRWGPDVASDGEMERVEAELKKKIQEIKAKLEEGKPQPAVEIRDVKNGEEEGQPRSKVPKVDILEVD
jgi:hypothetical protein